MRASLSIGNSQEAPRQHCVLFNKTCTYKPKAFIHFNSYDKNKAFHIKNVANENNSNIYVKYLNIREMFKKWIYSIIHIYILLRPDLSKLIKQNNHNLKRQPKNE